MHWGTSRAELGHDKNFGNEITKIHFFLPPNRITRLSSLSYFFLQFWQSCYQNLVSLLILLNNFE